MKKQKKTEKIVSGILFALAGIILLMLMTPSLAVVSNDWTGTASGAEMVSAIWPEPDVRIWESTLNVLMKLAFNMLILSGCILRIRRSSRKTQIVGLLCALGVICLGALMYSWLQGEAQDFADARNRYFDRYDFNDLDLVRWGESDVNVWLLLCVETALAAPLALLLTNSGPDRCMDAAVGVLLAVGLMLLFGTPGGVTAGYCDAGLEALPVLGLVIMAIAVLACAAWILVRRRWWTLLFTLLAAAVLAAAEWWAFQDWQQHSEVMELSWMKDMTPFMAEMLYGRSDDPNMVAAWENYQMMQSRTPFELYREYAGTLSGDGVVLARWALCMQIAAVLLTGLLPRGMSWGMKLLRERKRDSVTDTQS